MGRRENTGKTTLPLKYNEAGHEQSDLYTSIIIFDFPWKK